MPEGFEDHWDRPRIGRLEFASRDVAVPGGHDVDYWRLPSEPVEEPPQISVDLRRYWAVIVKRKFLIASIVVAALVLGIAATLLMTPIYTAQATVEIDRESARVVAGQDVQPQEQAVSAEEFFQTQYGLLRSRSLADRVSQALGLARSDKFLKEMGAKRIATTEAARRDQVLGELQKHLGVDPVRGSRLAVVSFQSPIPQLSAQIANAFAENFIAANLDRRFESSSYARDFLEKRIEQVKEKLEDSERQLVAYASAQQIINLNDGDKTDPNHSQSLAAADLTALNSALAAAQANRIAAEQKLRQADAPQDYGTNEILTSPIIQQLSEERAKTAAEYQDKLKIFKPEFPTMLQLRAHLNELDAQIKRETDRVRSSVAESTRTAAQAAYNVAANEEHALQAKVDQLKSAVLDLRSRSIRYNILQREVDTNRTLYDGLLQRYKEVAVAGGVAANNLSIVDRAEPPLVPSKPRPLLNAAVSMVLGLGSGVLLAFLLEALDQAIRSPADIEKLGLPLLGIVPMLPKGQTPAEALADIRSGLSEAYFSLTTALQLATTGGTPRSLLVTSSRQDEGKSTTSRAIAQNFARTGLRTLLIDGDLRNPSLHKVMGLDNEAGLSTLLVGAASLESVIQPTQTPHLDVISSGPLPPSPAELLASGRLRQILNQAENLFDVIIVDGPPVMGLADAPIISSVVEGTLLVVQAGGVGRNQARAAYRRLQMSRGKVLGIALTKFNARKDVYGYSYAYDYEYGAKLPAALKA